MNCGHVWIWNSQVYKWFNKTAKDKNDNKKNMKIIPMSDLTWRNDTFKSRSDLFSNYSSDLLLDFKSCSDLKS